MDVKIITGIKKEWRYLLMSNSSASISRRAVHSLVGVAIMLLFRYLPLHLPEVTPVGMEIIGVFIGTLYLWTTVDPVWSSLLSIFMIGVSSYGPMNQVLSAAFGNPVVIQMLFLMIVMNSMVYNKLTAYIGRFFLTMKINNGRPWVFTAMLMVGAMLMAAFVGPFYSGRCFMIFSRRSALRRGKSILRLC